MTRSSDVSSGYTLVELLISMVVMAILLTAIVAQYFIMIRTTSHERVQTQTASEVQQAIALIERDITYATAIMTKADYEDAFSPDGATWSYKGVGDKNRVLILRNYATTTNPLDDIREPVYLNTELCGTDDMRRSEVLTYNTIYFIDSTSQSLVRRLLVPDDAAATACAVPYQLRTCPNGPASGVGCFAEDEIVARGIGEFDIKYFMSPQATTEIDAYSHAAVLEEVGQASAVEVSIGVGGQSFEEAIGYRTSLRIPKIN